MMQTFLDSVNSSHAVQLLLVLWFVFAFSIYVFAYKNKYFSVFITVFFLWLTSAYLTAASKVCTSLCFGVLLILGASVPLAFGLLRTEKEIPIWLSLGIPLVLTAVFAVIASSMTFTFHP